MKKKIICFLCVSKKGKKYAPTALDAEILLGKRQFDTQFITELTYGPHTLFTAEETALFAISGSSKYGNIYLVLIKTLQESNIEIFKIGHIWFQALINWYNRIHIYVHMYMYSMYMPTLLWFYICIYLSVIW